MNTDLCLAISTEYAVPVVMHLEHALDLAFEEHDSDYKGAYWLYVIDDNSEIEVYYNEDPMFRPGDPPDERYFEAGHKQHRVLLRASGVTTSFAERLVAAIEQSFQGSVVVRRGVAQSGIQLDDPTG